MKTLSVIRVNVLSGVMKVNCLLRIVAVVCLINLLTCGNRDNGPAGIRLSGRVVDSHGEPMGGVLVRLTGADVAGMTDSNGTYRIVDPSFEVPPAASDTLDMAIDSIAYRMNTQFITSAPVFRWIDSLPDMTVDIRSFHGTVVKNSEYVLAAEARVTTDGLDSAIHCPLFYDSSSGAYHGVFYFGHTSAVREYTVVVHFFGRGTQYLGAGRKLIFPSTSGELYFADFAAEPPFPVLKVPEVIEVSVNDTVRFSGTATPSPGTEIRYFGVMSGSTGGYTEIPSIDTQFIAPVMATEILLDYLVVDNYENTATARVHVVVAQDVPAVKAGLHCEKYAGDNLLLNPFVHDRFGEIVKREWSFAGGDMVPMTHSDTVITVPFTPGVYAYTHQVTDDDDNVASSTMLVTVLEPGERWSQLQPGFTLPGTVRMQVCKGTLFILSVDTALDKQRVWMSSDGGAWDAVTDSAGYTARKVAAVTEFRDSLWMIAGDFSDSGGCDLWHSEDGAAWVHAGRAGAVGGVGVTEMAACVFRDSLWIVCAGTADSAGGIWRSGDGVSFDKVMDAPGTSMEFLAGAVVFLDMLWIAGPDSMLWKSADGITFEAVDKSLWDVEAFDAVMRSGDCTANERRMVCTNGRYLFHTDDGGTMHMATTLDEEAFPALGYQGSAVVFFENALWAGDGETGSLWYTR